MKHTDIYNPKTHSFLRRSISGYLWFFRNILWLAAAVGLVAMTGLLIVYPLWFFASSYKNAYSLFALGLVFLALGLALLGKLKASIRSCGGFFSWLRKRFFRALKKILYALLAMGVLYALISLFVRGYTLAAGAGTLVYLVFLGAFLAGRREAH